MMKKLLGLNFCIWKYKLACQHCHYKAKIHSIHRDMQQPSAISLWANKRSLEASCRCSDAPVKRNLETTKHPENSFNGVPMRADSEKKSFNGIPTRADSEKTPLMVFLRALIGKKLL